MMKYSSDASFISPELVEFFDLLAKFDHQDNLVADLNSAVPTEGFNSASNVNNKSGIILIHAKNVVEKVGKSRKLNKGTI